MSVSSNDPIMLTGGIDVGNGYVKGVIQNTKQGTFDEIDLPSAVVSTSRTSPKVPLPDTDAVSVMSGDFYNQIDCSLTTPLVAASDRRIFGRAALSVRGSKFTEFEVLGKHSKADQELSKVLVLGVFAAKALRDYVRENEVLPDHELRVQVRAGLALPISEFVARRHAYAAEFIGLLGSADPTVHLVTIKNFSTPVSVRLQFVDVQVMAEGASAQFAITDKGEPLAQALLDDLRARDAALVDGVSASDLVAVQNTIGVDVGEGTVNFPVFTDGRFNPEAADTLDEGYGTALMNAMERMIESDATLQFSSRKQLADFLHAEPSVLVRNRHQRASGFVEDEAGYLVDEIVSSFGDVLSQAGATTEVVYVYGGGSGPIKHLLHPALLKAAGDVPVLYLDSSYSRHLNREGLYIAARHVEQQSLVAKPAVKRSKEVA
ncbi:ParM/StbA family protein [Streptomyces acidiscabies]|uniref:ParM/StbA family protein n=1 Tax=Streptomyces acidiscabies TaxID=42234 RepID=A0ABU4LWG7_9ACTN|nr:ParM/StbA family protein [Streptomyces acidiscabies]MDX3020053.1 ParM/StbA family protein [Streptomyces acidiscabies]